LSADQAQRLEWALKWAALAELNVDRVAATYVSSDPVVGALFKERFATTQKQTNEIQALLESAAADDTDKALLKDVSNARAVVIAEGTKAGELKQAGDIQATQKHVTDVLMPSTSRYIESLNAFAKRQVSRMAELNAERDAQRSRNALFVAVAAKILVKSLQSTLQIAVSFSESIAKGDLTRQVHTERGDELGDVLRALGSMNESLSGVIRSVREGTDSITVASSEIADGNQDLSVRTEQTANHLQQSASALSGLTESVQHNAQAASHANQLAVSAAQVAQRGGAVVTEVVARMKGINDSSRKIADIISVIDGIAFQTNILALNAAVEAARAGEQGRGFAVVASEVRSLAGRSAEAAREIKSLITASVEQVEAGTDLVSNAGKTMEEIVAAVGQVSAVIAEITSSTAEQSHGIAQVNQTVGQLDQMTQQNAAMVEQAAAAASSLKDQADRLSEVVSTFQVTGTGLRALGMR
ncbi:MAG: methyl-accepting chemotaxis protein, partial [Burkholderiales bacterium PBB4]